MYCRNCHYDLRGQIEFRCPECGRGYDPDDPSTFEDTPPSTPRQFLLRLRRLRVVLVGVATLALAANCYYFGSKVPTSSRGEVLRGWVTTLHAYKILGEWSRQQEEASARSCFDVAAAKEHIAPSCSDATYEMCGPRWDARNLLRVAPSFLWPAAIYGIIVAILFARSARWPVAIWFSFLIACLCAHYYPSAMLDHVWPRSYAYLDDFVYVCGADLSEKSSDPDDRVVLYAKKRTSASYNSDGGYAPMRDVGYADRTVNSGFDDVLARLLKEQGIDVDPDVRLLEFEVQFLRLKNAKGK